MESSDKLFFSSFALTIFYFVWGNSNNFIASWWTDFRIIHQNVTVDDSKEFLEGPTGVNTSITANLTCQSSRAFEYCTWMHMGKTCKFEWKWYSSTVEKQDNCTLDSVKSETNESIWTSRITFKGDYHKYECKIKVDHTSAWDFGDWTCEMESYVFGPLKGYTKRKIVHLTGYNKTKKLPPNYESFNKLKNELAKV